ncbi:type IV pilus assembly protein PilM [Aestuariibacter salexigens]|uniref:type IV pilus assembly protein PilM n=1 Tax=Aestuariibacter salexigens TaxID=226010 RepID=UPI00047DA73B|nr:type IV pilus assembly protein PilM [Aestuariibacter salexigens]
MKALFQKQIPQMIGLDIGTRFIKAVLLEKDGDGYKIQQAVCESIGGNAFDDRAIKDFDTVSKALAKVKKSLKIKNKAIATAVAGPSVISKIVFMEPEQTDYELEGQIEIEADSLIPYPLDEVYLDFEELGPSASHNSKVEVLLTAAHKDLIDSRMLLLREAPFEPKVMDVESNALANALKFFNPSGAGEETCCFNIGASLMQMCVLDEEGNVKYTKEHTFGLDNLIQDLALVHSLEKDEAEQQLLEGTLPANWRTDTYPVFLANLQQQINRAIQLYTSSTHAQRPASIVICGGGACITGIADDLSQDLGIGVSVFNPFADMATSDKVNSETLTDFAPQLAIAAGLASRSFTPWHI